MAYKKISMDSIPHNTYTRNLESSYKWLNDMQRDVLISNGREFPQKTWERMFSKKKAKMVNSVEELDLENTKTKTAVILLGMSGCGKTSYAKSLIKNFPKYKMLSVDINEMQIIISALERGLFLSTEVADAMASSEFGKKLNEYSKSNANIVIEGQYVYMNARGALIKTLRTLGYKEIIVISFLKIPMRAMKERRISRALEYTYYDTIKATMSNEEYAKLHMKNFGEKIEREIEEIKSISEWKLTPEYQRNYDQSLKEYEEEQFMSGLSFQQNHNLFIDGVDKFVNLF